MKKLFFMIAMCLTLASCSNTAHWSHKACVDEIVKAQGLTAYSYTVKEIPHEETVVGDDEVRCFDITVTSGDWSQRYCCFAVIDDNEVLYVDCDRWSNGQAN